MTEEVIETSKDESEFIEIGYICNVHGLQGELRIKPTTDFPELRFSKVKIFGIIKVYFHPLSLYPVLHELLFYRGKDG